MIRAVQLEDPTRTGTYHRPLRNVRGADQAPTGSTMFIALSLGGGGAERLLSNLMAQRRLPAEDQFVVTLYPGGEFRASVEASGVEVLDLGMRSRADAPRALFRLIGLLRARRPAVIHAWDYIANILASLALAAAGRGATRLIWAILGSDVDVRQYPWRLRYYRAIGRLLSPYADGIIYNAYQARDYHEAIGFRPPRTLVIPNCLDTHEFRRDAELRETVRRELAIPRGAVVVVIAARVDPMKDWGGMLSAVAGLPGVVTVAIGKGTERLPQQPGLLRLGWRYDVPRILNAADIFMLGSAFGEGTSLAVIEAMSCSLPCVVTDVGGNGTIVGDAGIVVPRRQRAAVRDAIMQLVRDPERREAMGCAARARLASGYSPDDVAAMLRGFARCGLDAA
jgi:glycosyltransferase involved in cell wall biosynthesis